MDTVNHRENPFIPSGSIIDFEDSSNLDMGLFYSSGSMGVLETLFKNGAWYRYHHVGPAVMNAIWQGRPTRDGSNMWSKGAAFHMIVRSRPDLYPYEPIDEKEVGALAKAS